MVDADAIAREVVEPDGPAFGSVVARFGMSVIGADGRLDRRALAAVVFNDQSALADLNAITHPLIGATIGERVRQAALASEIVVVDVPLLDSSSRSRFGLDAVVVVDAPEDEAVRRLVEQRGFTKEDAQARVASQIGRDERRSFADVVIENSGTREDLEDRIASLWSWLVEHAGRAAGGSVEGAPGA